LPDHTKSNRSPAKAKGSNTNNRNKPTSPRAPQSGASNLLTSFVGNTMTTANNVNAEALDRNGISNNGNLQSLSPTSSGIGNQEPLTYTNFEQLLGKIYMVSKDQQGCRFLQKKLEEQDPEVVNTIFNEVFGYITELMTGNYYSLKKQDSKLVLQIHLEIICARSY
jgi:hypothetical protein